MQDRSYIRALFFACFGTHSLSVLPLKQSLCQYLQHQHRCGPFDSSLLSPASPPPPYSSSYRIIKNELNRGSISASAPGYSANPPELARINPVVDTQKNPRLTPLVEEKDGFWVLKPENHVGINPAEKVIFSSLPPLFLRFLNSNDLSWITF